MDKITAHWSIHLNGNRSANIGKDITLIATNGRTRGGWGPVVWAVVKRGEVVATGETWQGGRYQALVRQAMFEAEQAAKELAS